jgi:hypothetical protein
MKTNINIIPVGCKITRWGRVEREVPPKSTSTEVKYVRRNKKRRRTR